MTPIKIVAYINGSPIYPQSFSGSFPGSGAFSFALQVPPIPDWLVLPPRSVASVFYWDVIDSAWRLLCDGEYVGRASTATAAGTRSLSLSFRSLHAWTDTQKYITLLNIIQSKENAVETFARAAINGYVFDTSDATGNLTPPPLQSLTKFMSDAQLEADVPTMFSKVLQAIALQAPIDAFYYKFRKLKQRQTFVSDSDSQELFSNQFLRAMIASRTDVFSAFKDETSITSLMSVLLDLAFYKSLDLPNPPSDGSTIRAHVFTPSTYETVPPACNVIYADQIVSDQEARSFLATPTRVAVNTTLVGSAASIPTYYVATSATKALNVNGTKTGMSAMHGAFSTDELSLGVIPRITSVPLNLTSAGEDVAQGVPRYLEAMARHQYMVERGSTLTRSLQCQFLPYVMPGFTCLVENFGGSFYAYVEAVSHSIDATGAAMTSLQLTHVRPLQIMPGPSNNAPLPKWINSKYIPQSGGGIDKTYKDFFGVAGGAFGARPGSEKAAAAAETLYHPPFNVDLWASSIVPVPEFDAAGRYRGMSSITIADGHRAAGDPAVTHRRMLGAQYRSGTLMRDYKTFYNFDSDDIDLTPGDFAGPSGWPYARFSYVFATPTGLPLDPAQLAASKQGGSDWYKDQEDAGDTATAGVFKVAGVTFDRAVIAQGISDRLANTGASIVKPPLPPT